VVAGLGGAGLAGAGALVGLRVGAAQAPARLLAAAVGDTADVAAPAGAAGSAGSGAAAQGAVSASSRMANGMANAMGNGMARPAGKPATPGNAATGGSASGKAASGNLASGNAASGGAISINPQTGLPSTAAASAAAPVVAAVPAIGGIAQAITVEYALSRLAFGANPTARAEVNKVSVRAWMTQQLNPASIPDPDGDAVVALYPWLNRPMKDVVAEYQRNPNSTVNPAYDAIAATLGRAIWSKRQLFERMVGFWSDHFTVPITIDIGRETRADYDRTVIRAHALGRFEDLLVAVANHPSMLYYLNLSGSTGTNPNENFARELLELHTVGVDGGYTENDIKQAAKLLTGLVVNADMSVSYLPDQHYVGAVKVMSFSSANTDKAKGPDAARALYKYLAHHPSTARHIGLKLARHFVSDNPPDSLVRTLAKVYLNSDTAIAPVLHALFSHSSFAHNPEMKLRRPMEQMAAVARAIQLRPGTDPQSLLQLLWELGRSGHIPFNWHTPDGYPDVADAWQASGMALAEFDVATNLLHGWWPQGFGYPKVIAMLSDPAKATTIPTITAQLTQRLFGRAPLTPESTAVHTLLTGGPNAPTSFPNGSWAQEWAVGNATLLLFLSPSFLTR
jgi:uncharacterized protein (DUF1800 family)